MRKTFKIIFKILLSLLIILSVAAALSFGYLLSKERTQGEISWRSCYRPTFWSWFNLPPPAQLQCAAIELPLDDTQDKTVTIAMTRLPSANADAKDLLLLSGGPGGHSLDMIGWLSDDEYTRTLKDNFHVLGIAQRGVKPSTAIVCGGALEEDGAKAYVDACVAHSGLDFIKSISTIHTVHDLDKIRTKLNIDSWSMLGYSYGTKIVAQYAEHYPSHLRAGVLDGVVDTSEDLFTIWANQQTGAQIAFYRFMSNCHQDPSCIFGQSDDQNREFLTKIAKLSAQKLTDKNNDPIDERAILGMIENNLGDELTWSEMYVMLDELSHGKTSKYNELLFIQEFGEQDFSQDAFVGINCADSAPKDRSDYLARAKAIEKIAAYNDIERSDDELLDACYYWPFDGADDLDANLISDDTPTLLFVAQAHDFATPLSNAKNMANRFGDYLIYTPYFGHTISLSGANACIDGAVVDYLVNGDKPDVMVCR